MPKFSTDAMGRTYYAVPSKDVYGAFTLNYYPDVDGFYEIRGNRYFRDEVTGLMARAW